MNLQDAFSLLKNSPLQQIESALLDSAEIQLFIKRDDLLDPAFGGNKWRKLKFNLLAAQKSSQKTLLTFGGAWSNHIYATAAAGNKFGFKTIGIIRGERPKTLSSTLAFAQANQMQLEFITRKQYRLKNTAIFIQSLHEKFGNFYCLPEGGSNTLALKGVQEIITEIDIDFDIITCACGTGATLAGLVSGLKNHQSAIGYAALKGADFLNTDVKQQLAEFYNTESNKPQNNQYTIETGYHFGGYAKMNNTLSDFIIGFKNEFDITLDGVYTGKMFYALFDQIKKRAFPPGTKIIAVHTGGIQGNAGFSALEKL